jgi:hypothetical protein
MPATWSEPVGLSLALAHSTIAHKWLPVGTSFGKNPAGLLILDPDGVEDQFGTADVPIVFEYPSGKISLLQMEGVLIPSDHDHNHHGHHDHDHSMTINGLVLSSSFHHDHDHDHDHHWNSLPS